MAKKLDPLNLGIAASIYSAVFMLVLSILSLLGVYSNAAIAMQQWHLFYNTTVLGIVGGIIEAAVLGFILAYTFGWIYIKIEEKRK